MFKYSDSNKRYHTLDYYYKNKYNSKVFKVSLNLGFSCPNIDGTKGIGGCIYCKNGSGNNLDLSVYDQFEKIKNMIHKKWPVAKYIAYFQSNSNTYKDLDKLKKVSDEVLDYPNVVGINIATRCDAIDDECFLYLLELNKRTDLVIELGLQTINDDTANIINRCHTLLEFENMYKRLKGNNIKVVVHIINGLPYEDKEDMLNTVKYLNKLKVDGIKIHMLHILKGTKLLELYNKEKFSILTREEYVDIVCDQLELLDEKIVINRITGDPEKDDLVEPNWLIKKFGVLNEIDKEMKKRDSYQGKNNIFY